MEPVKKVDTASEESLDTSQNMATKSSRVMRKSARIQTRKISSKSSSDKSHSDEAKETSKSKVKTRKRRTIKPSAANLKASKPSASKPSALKSSTSKSSTSKSSTSKSSEKVLTPKTPEISSELILKKPWFNDDFLNLVIDELKTSTTDQKRYPKMLIIIGPPGAGKTTVKNQLDYRDAVNIDVDEVKIIGVREFGPRAKGMFADFGKLVQLLSKKIIDRGYDIIIDTTGKMKEPIKYSMKNAKNNSYIIDLAIVYSTVDLCKTRVGHRNVEYTKRDRMPTFVVEKTYNEFKSSKLAKSYLLGIKDMISMIDNLYLFDNSRCTREAALILEKHGNETIVYEDFPDYYGVSIQQISPHMLATGIKKKSKRRRHN